jgi:hypothetical protein
MMKRAVGKLFAVKPMDFRWTFMPGLLAGTPLLMLTAGLFIIEESLSLPPLWGKVVGIIGGVFVLVYGLFLFYFLFYRQGWGKAIMQWEQNIADAYEKEGK